MNALYGALAALGGVSGLYAILTPVRRAWRAKQADVREHNLDHKGRPARIDPSTGREISPAQPGLASAVAEVRIDVKDIKAHLTQTTDNTAAINEIRDLLRQQALENDRRHAENRLAIAESRAEVSKLETTVQRIETTAREAAAKAADAAGHAARIDQVQKEHREHIEAEFARHKQIEQAYRTAIIDMGMPVEVPPT